LQFLAYPCKKVESIPHFCKTNSLAIFEEEIATFDQDKAM